MRRTIIIQIAAAVIALMAASEATGQTPQQSSADQRAASARNGDGLRVGTWDTETLKQPGATYQSTPAIELFFQRGLDQHVALETSAGIWRRRSVTPQSNDGPVITRSYVVPICSTLKIYPLTPPKVLLEPYLLGGAGFAIGVDNVSTNAIGGGGKSTSAGFGFKVAAGMEIHPIRELAVSAAWRYLSVKFGDAIGGQEAYYGSGLEAGLIYHPKR